MPDKPAAKGKGLGKKLGPLPTWAWLLVGALAVWFFFLRKPSTGSAGSVVPATSSTGSQTPDQSMGLVPSAGSSGDTGAGVNGSGGAATADLINAFGGMQNNLIQGLLGSEANVVALATAQLQAASASQPNGSGGDGGNQTPTVTSQPGGSNAPVVTHKATPAPVVTRLKSGATVTTYASGLKIQSATPGVKGSTPYVIHKAVR